MATQQNLTVFRGDKWSYPATFTLASGTLVGVTLWMTLKSALADADPGLVQIRSDGVSPGVVITDGTHATFTLTPAQTNALPTTALFYDVQVKLPSGDVYTTQSGRFIVTADVTRTTT